MKLIINKLRIEDNFMYRLGIIIVNYRTPKLIKSCLLSLSNQININEDRVIIVDNASGDDSDILIQEYIDEYDWRNWVYLVCSKENGAH